MYTFVVVVVVIIVVVVVVYKSFVDRKNLARKSGYV